MPAGLIYFRHRKSARAWYKRSRRYWSFSAVQMIHGDYPSRVQLCGSQSRLLHSCSSQKTTATSGVFLWIYRLSSTCADHDLRRGHMLLDKRRIRGRWQPVASSIAAYLRRRRGLAFNRGFVVEVSTRWVVVGQIWLNADSVDIYSISQQLSSANTPVLQTAFESCVNTAYMTAPAEESSIHELPPCTSPCSCEEEAFIRVKYVGLFMLANLTEQPADLPGIGIRYDGDYNFMNKMQQQHTVQSRSLVWWIFVLSNLSFSGSLFTISPIE